MCILLYSLRKSAAKALDDVDGKTFSKQHRPENAKRLSEVVDEATVPVMLYHLCIEATLLVTLGLLKLFDLVPVARDAILVALDPELGHGLLKGNGLLKVFDLAQVEVGVLNPLLSFLILLDDGLLEVFDLLLHALHLLARPVLVLGRTLERQPAADALVGIHTQLDAHLEHRAGHLIYWVLSWLFRMISCICFVVRCKADRDMLGNDLPHA